MRKSGAIKKIYVITVILILTIIMSGCFFSNGKDSDWVDAKSISLNKSETTIMVSLSEKLTYTIEPSNASVSAVWLTSDESVAKVDSTTGVVTAVKVGKATIKAKVTGGPEATCEVTVTEYKPDFESGIGTEADPYIIKSARGMQDIELDLNAHYKLESNVDLGLISWMPIGTRSNPFTGSFNGGGYTVSNLTIDQNTSDNNYGMFGYLTGAVVSNFKLANVSIDVKTNTSLTGGAVAGIAYLSTEFSDIEVSGVIDTSQTYNKEEITANVGGLVGYLSGGLIEKCKANVELENQAYYNAYAGGLVGYLNGGTIRESWSKGSVKADGYGGTGRDTNPRVGGFIGYMKSGNVSDCYSNSSTLSRDAGLLSTQDSGFVAGFVATVISGQIEYCYASGLVGRGSRKGGFISLQSGGTFSNCINISDMTGQSKEYHTSASNTSISGISSLASNALSGQFSGWSQDKWNISDTNLPTLK